MFECFDSRLEVGQLYHFQATGPFDPEAGQWFRRKRSSVDPYAKALAGLLSAIDGWG